MEKLKPSISCLKCGFQPNGVCYPLGTSEVLAQSSEPHLRVDKDPATNGESGTSTPPFHSQLLRVFVNEKTTPVSSRNEIVKHSTAK